MLDGKGVPQGPRGSFTHPAPHGYPASHTPGHHGPEAWGRLEIGRGGNSESLHYHMNPDPRKRGPLKVERGATLKVSPTAGDPGGTMRPKAKGAAPALCPKRATNRSPPRASDSGTSQCLSLTPDPASRCKDPWFPGGHGHRTGHSLTLVPSHESPCPGSPCVPKGGGGSRWEAIGTLELCSLLLPGPPQRAAGGPCTRK